MAGHTSEKRWRRNQNPIFGNVGVSELASGLTTAMIDVLTKAESAFSELQELFNFVGGTVQGMADQLFFEDYSARTVPGVDAVMDVDIAAGIVTDVNVSVAGTAYPDGFAQTLALVSTGGGDGTAVVTYDVVGGTVVNARVTNGGTGYTDGTATDVVEVPSAGTVAETQANAEELGKTQDLFDAVTGLHEMHQCANNQAVATEDRYAQFRRMS